MLQCRKTVVMIEDVRHDGGPVLAAPLRKGAAAAVVNNPYAGRYVEDLIEWMESLRPLGLELAERLLDALGFQAADVQAFGKGAIVGVNGEIEHAAVWHAPGGHGMRQLLDARGFVTSGQIIGTIGAHLHIPLASVHSPWVRSHFDGVDITISDAPKPDELVFAVAMSNGGRPHARIGGLSFAEAADGQGPKF
ncbi:hypothetical protein JI59_19800 (plasmid) [Novosphingobium pentaromativorans US6-1]|nr:hypothetical protein JI59_19800 [Novosphingobium pentaromativorans US6-1]